MVRTLGAVMKMLMQDNVVGSEIFWPPFIY